MRIAEKDLMQVLKTEKQSFASEDFATERDRLTAPLTHAFAAWNEAVAFLVEGFSRHTGRDEEWHKELAGAVRNMREPLRSDFILSPLASKLVAPALTGRVRTLNATLLEEDLEFMPRRLDYPKFPYFEVEPATLTSLAAKGLVLLANPAGAAEDEPDHPGTRLDRGSYMRRPVVSVELSLSELPQGVQGALLLNWSCRGRDGAAAKVFINGVQHVRSFDVQTTADDSVPNFWTFVPWKTGRTIVDLKHVGSGYLWFEHVDVHRVNW